MIAWAEQSCLSVRTSSTSRPRFVLYFPVLEGLRQEMIQLALQHLHPKKYQCMAKPFLQNICLHNIMFWRLPCVHKAYLTKKATSFTIDFTEIRGQSGTIFIKLNPSWGIFVLMLTMPVSVHQRPRTGHRNLIKRLSEMEVELYYGHH